MYPIETLGALRIFSSAGRLDSAFTGKDAKFAASFLDGSGLVERIDKSFVRTALSPSIASVLTGFVDPHAALFAAIIAVADAFIGISLLLNYLPGWAAFSPSFAA